MTGSDGRIDFTSMRLSTRFKILCVLLKWHI